MDMSKPGVISSAVAYMRQLPNSIGELKHLRYLNLSGNAKLTELPESLCSLINLQTLKIDRCWELKNLPRAFGKLINLRYLTIERCDRLSYMPAGFGNLKSLQGLTRFIVANEPQDCGKLNQLKELNNLRGKVRIERLGLVRDVASESQDANLQQKEYLRSLTIDWYSPTQGRPMSVTDANVDVALRLLENLKPHSNIQGLEVLAYPGLGFSSWLYTLTNLVRLKLRYLTNCQHLPQMNQLPSLEYLEIYGLSALEHILYHCSGVEDGSSCTTTFFPSLKQLEIHDWRNLKGWKRLQGKNVTEKDLQEDEKDQMSLPSFPCLSKLTVCDCPKLTCMPFYPSLEAELYLVRSSVKPFLETVMMNRTHMGAAAENKAVPSASTRNASIMRPSLAPLSKLKSIHFLPADSDAVSTPKEVMKIFTSLESLRVSYFPALPSLSRQFQYLTALKKLRIEDDSADTSIEWQALGSLGSLEELSLYECESLRNLPDCICNGPSLREIKIFNCANLASLPERMRGLTSLEKLELGNIQSLTTLLEWMGNNLPSLRNLGIFFGLYDMESLPEGMRGLKKLQRLDIARSGNLKTIPEWISELTSLRQITIDDCCAVVSLPEGMRHLTNLQTLTIRECPWLRDRCRREHGEDWDKIKHVPNLIWQ